MPPKHGEQVNIWFIKGSLYGCVFDNMQIKASNLLEIDNKHASVPFTAVEKRR